MTPKKVRSNKHELDSYSDIKKWLENYIENGKKYEEIISNDAPLSIF